MLNPGLNQRPLDFSLKCLLHHFPLCVPPPLCRNPGLNQRPLDFSLKCLLHHFPLCVPPPLSSFSLSLSLSLSLFLSLASSPFHSLCASSFVSLPLYFLLLHLLLAEKKTPKRKTSRFLFTSPYP